MGFRNWLGIRKSTPKIISEDSDDVAKNKNITRTSKAEFEEDLKDEKNLQSFKEHLGIRNEKDYHGMKKLWDTVAALDDDDPDEPKGVLKGFTTSEYKTPRILPSPGGYSPYVPTPIPAAVAPIHRGLCTEITSFELKHTMREPSTFIIKGKVPFHQAIGIDIPSETVKNLLLNIPDSIFSSGDHKVTQQDILGDRIVVPSPKLTGLKPTPPLLQATQTILEDIMGISVPNESEALLCVMTTILKSVRAIFEWVNPKHDITLTLGGKSVVSEVRLDHTHKISIRLHGYDDSQAAETSGDPVRHCLIVYEVNKKVATQKTIRPRESDIIGCLSVIRSDYPCQGLDFNGVGYVVGTGRFDPKFTPYKYDSPKSSSTVLTTLFHDHPLRLIGQMVMYLNPNHTALRGPMKWPIDADKGEPWFYAWNKFAIHNMIKQGTLVKYRDPDSPSQTEPIQWVEGDVDNPAFPSSTA